MNQTDFGTEPLGKRGGRAKDEVKIEFDVRLTSKDAKSGEDKIDDPVRALLFSGTSDNRTFQNAVEQSDRVTTDSEAIWSL